MEGPGAPVSYAARNPRSALGHPHGDTSRGHPDKRNATRARKPNIPLTTPGEGDKQFTHQHANPTRHDQTRPMGNKHPQQTPPQQLAATTPTSSAARRRKMPSHPPPPPMQPHRHRVRPHHPRRQPPPRQPPMAQPLLPQTKNPTRKQSAPKTTTATKTKTTRKTPSRNKLKPRNKNTSETNSTRKTKTQNKNTSHQQPPPPPGTPPPRGVLANRRIAGTYLRAPCVVFFYSVCACVVACVAGFWHVGVVLVWARVLGASDRVFDSFRNTFACCYGLAARVFRVISGF